MPALPPVANVLKYSITGTDSANTPWGTRMFMQWSGTTPTTTILTAFANSVFTSYTAHLASFTTPGYTLTKVVITDLTSSTGATVTQPGSVPGTGAGGTLPAGTAVLINHHILRRYRGGKPRSYWPPMSVTSLLDSDHWNSAAQTGYQAAYASFIGDLIAAPSGGCTLTNHVNVGYYAGFKVFTTSSGRAKNIPQLKTPPIIPDVISSSTVNALVGSQRRRYSR